MSKTKKVLLRAIDIIALSVFIISFKLVIWDVLIVPFFVIAKDYWPFYHHLFLNTVNLFADYLKECSLALAYIPISFFIAISLFFNCVYWLKSKIIS